MYKGNPSESLYYRLPSKNMNCTYYDPSYLMQKNGNKKCVQQYCIRRIIIDFDANLQFFEKAPTVSYKVSIKCQIKKIVREIIIILDTSFLFTQTI